MAGTEAAAAAAAAAAAVKVGVTFDARQCCAFAAHLGDDASAPGPHVAGATSLSRRPLAASFMVLQERTIPAPAISNCMSKRCPEVLGAPVICEGRLKAPSFGVFANQGSMVGDLGFGIDPSGLSVQVSNVSFSLPDGFRGTSTIPHTHGERTMGFFKQQTDRATRVSRLKELRFSSLG